MTGDARTLEGVVIAHVGHHVPEYSRNRSMAKALTRAGAHVVDMSDRRGYAARTVGFVRELRRRPPDLVLVGFPGHSDVLAARLAMLPRRVPVVLDALVSIYETAVDRQQISRYSVAARRYLFQDRAACTLADLVMLDTDTHIEYFRHELGVRHGRFAKVWVGSDDEIMRLVPRTESDTLRVLFYGTYIPLHGAEHIVRAAHELERTGDPVEVVMVGDGQTYGDVRRLADRLGVRSLRFTRRLLAYDDLPALIGGSDVCLGVFGTTAKAARVIPNKVFDGLAMARTIVTADTPAAREALTDRVDCRLCPPGDASALAEILRGLQRSPETTVALACRGHELFQAEFSLAALSRRVAPLFRELVDG